MSVEIIEGVHWINECYSSGETHLHISVYLIEHDDQSILLDTGTFYHRDEITTQINALTDGTGPDAIVLSHNDLHHVGNVSRFREDWDNVDLWMPYSGATYGPSDIGLGSANQYKHVNEFNILGRPLSAIQPILADRASVSWTFDQTSGGIFTSDGFGHYHRPNTCDQLSSGMDRPFELGELRRYHHDTFQWLENIDVDTLMNDVTGLVEDSSVSYVAPTHGRPIMADDIPTLTELFRESVVAITNR